MTDRFTAIQSSDDWGGRVTRAEVDLDAIEGNAAALVRSVAPSMVMAVVKANGYGHGDVQVVEAALRGGASWVGVYTVEEGVSLRRAGITTPILVFGPFGHREARQIVAHDLRATVTGTTTAEALAAAAGDTPVRFHLKLDTGLTRAGVPHSDAVAFAHQLSTYPQLLPEGLYTHFAMADDADTAFTHQQVALFDDTCAQLSAAGLRFSLHHLANSAGALNIPTARRDMVRCGIALYGYYPSHAVASGVALRPALSLISSVARVYVAPAGVGVGYGHEFRCRRPTTVALVPVGYGDGLPRALGEGRGRVLIRGYSAPIIGRVSMDQMTLDVTRIPGVRVGERAVLIGSSEGVEQTATDLAVQAGTVHYDILSGLLPRVPRLYIRQGEVSA